MNFARLWEQALDLWSRPVGKVIFGGLAVFLVVLIAGTFTLTTPVYAMLGSFSSEDAPKVAAQLSEKKIPYKQDASGTAGTASFSFLVPDDRLSEAKLVLAEVNLDPNSSVWNPDLWKNRVSWSNTELDKRIQRIEQTETNLARSIMTLSVVDRARVQITVPMEQRLFARDEKPPKAMVVVMPRQGQKLTQPVVAGIMEMVANSVEGLMPENVVVADASLSRVVSADALKQPEAPQSLAAISTDLLAAQQKYQDHFQTALTQQLEKVVGPGNVSVIVTPTINWEKVMSEAVQYKGAGNAQGTQGIKLSEQIKKESSEGTPGGQGTPPAGVVANSEARTPTYPGAETATGGNASSEKVEQITNYLVDQTKTTSERPAGGIEGVAVGIIVNSAKGVDEATERRMKDLVGIAMGGNKAQVEVMAMPFADDLLKMFEEPPRQPVATGAPNWLYWVLGVALGLAGIALFMVATRPRRPVLEPVFAGPEAAMIGGIPVTEAEMPTLSTGLPMEESAPPEKKLPESAEELAQLSPEEIAALSDEFLLKLGVDPSKVRMKEKVEKIAKVQPEVVANLLRTWMIEE